MISSFAHVKPAQFYLIRDEEKVFSPTGKHEIERANAAKQKAAEAVNPWIERRVARRVPVSLAVTWEGLSGRQEARITDISLHGCFIESSASTSTGEKVTFVLKTPTNKLLLLQGQVAFAQPTVGFGLRFTEVSMQDETMLRQLIEFHS